MTLFSVEAFEFLYYANFFGVLICIPCLTYLANGLFNDKSNKVILWLRIALLGVISTAVTLGLAWYLVLFSFINNPMDPATKESQQEIEGD